MVMLCTTSLQLMYLITILPINHLTLPLTHMCPQSTPHRSEERLVSDACTLLFSPFPSAAMQIICQQQEQETHLHYANVLLVTKANYSCSCQRCMFVSKGRQELKTIPFVSMVISTVNCHMKLETNHLNTSQS